MQRLGSAMIFLGLLGLMVSIGVAVIDLGVRDQYFTGPTPTPWRYALNPWLLAGSFILAISGLIFRKKG